MTGKGTGAISTVQVFGDSAEDVVKKIFKPAGTKPAKFKTTNRTPLLTEGTLVKTRKSNRLDFFRDIFFVSQDDTFDDQVGHEGVYELTVVLYGFRG